MNYIKEINAFYDWLETNSISTSGIVLWHALMSINNKAGWIPEFAVAISILEAKTGIKRRSIERARNELAQKGRIIWRSRSGNQSAIYSIVGLTDAQCVAQCDVQTDVQCDAQVDAINKLNKTKQKERKKEEKEKISSYKKIIDSFTDNEKLREALWGYIQMRISKKAKPTDKALELVLKNLVLLSGDNMQLQIDILNQSIINNWTGIFPLREIKGVKEKANPSKGTFDNFSGRTYDPEDLKQKLLAKSRGDMHAGST